MATQPLIGIFTYPSLNLGRDLIRGITRYSNEQAGWRLFMNLGLDLPANRLVPTLDGAFISIANKEMLAFASGLGVPVMNVSGRLRETPFPRVCIDDEAAGRMAAGHFVERGFRSLAMCGTNARDHLSRLRERGYREVCGDWGLPEPRVFCCDQRTGYWAELLEWLRALPSPTGVFAEGDYDATLLRQAVWETGRHIPGDIAILGVGNDDLLCDVGTPALSSLEVPMVEIGYRAAERLDRWLRGETPEPREERLPPLRVVERGSTDIMLQDDPRIARALRLIREHACEELPVGWYARQAGINRRSMEIKFRETIRRSPREEILAQRILRACELLETTTLTVEEIARRCGYQHSSNFTRIFRAERGMTPGAWRKELRARTHGEEPA